MAEIIVADKAGFCWGVQRAINITRQALAENVGSRIYASGEIIHNKQVNKQLADEGLIFEPDTEKYDPDNSFFIVRSHGIGQSVVDRIKQRGLRVIDATCPYVKKVRIKLKQLIDEGYTVVVCGKQGHPEIDFVLSGFKNVIVAADETDLKAQRVNWNEIENIGLISQTTQSEKAFNEIKVYLESVVKNLKAFNTICEATEERQNAALALAPQCDAMVIVGGLNSSNTKNLFAICAKIQPRAVHIETADDLEKLPAEWFSDINRIGITAGASTPEYVLSGVVVWLDDRLNNPALKK